MESTEELQQLEITALQSIFGNDFIECPPPKAWKGAARLPEFIIRIANPDFPDKIGVQLHVKLPKTYPYLACPTFTLQKQAKGLSGDQLSKLQQIINAEAQKQRGNEMVFTIANLCQDWLVTNVAPLAEVSGSLAVQMTQRALDEEKNRKQRQAEQAAREEERRRMEQMELEAQIERDAQLRLQAKAEHRSRQRANSEATEVPFSPETPLQSFDAWIEVDGARFNTVKLFHPRQGLLETIYSAEPVSDSNIAIPPLELQVFTFETSHYSNSTGRRKLKLVEQEIKRLSTVRHPNLLSVFYVKLTLPHSSDPAQLIVLTEQAPHMSLYDVLQDSHFLREERASRYLTQILQGLNALHSQNPELLHRAIDTRCIGLATSRTDPTQKIIKIGRALYHKHLLDLHRSNSFGPSTPVVPPDDQEVSEGWLSRDVLHDSNLTYTRRRDIHNVGIVLLQMLLGLDVTEKCANVQEAIHSSSISPVLARMATAMMSVIPRSREPTCMSLLSDLAEDRLMHSGPGFQSSTSNRTTPISFGFPIGPRTPPVNGMFIGSPEVDLFVRPSAQPRHNSRWKEDWEELELLGKGAFGSVVKAKNKVDHRIYAVKKVRLKMEQNDSKIMREVNALSRLNHRFIVRYYTTWIETTDAPIDSAAASDESSAGSSEFDTDSADLTGANNLGRGGGFINNDFSFDDSAFNSLTGSSSDGSRGYSPTQRLALPGRTTQPNYRNPAHDGPINGNAAFVVSMADLDEDIGGLSSQTRTSFPSIHFENSQSPAGSDSSDPEEDGDGEFDVNGGGLLAVRRPTGKGKEKETTTPPWYGPKLFRTLYIQMEFVERQTLKERVEEGISEEEAWRLFHQIVDALVHMSSLGILHRDIKLTNIFIDAKGDCKIGDFGLATSNIAIPEPDAYLNPNSVQDADMTLEVGTRLYIAPENQSRSRRPAASSGRSKDHNKADMYSLGIVFFEMNHSFATASERIYVVEELRKPGIFFPTDWDSRRTRQKEIITWLLQHDPDKRPTAVDLSQSPLLPPRVEDEYFNEALAMIAKPDTPHYQTVLSLLFNRPPDRSRGYLYDKDLDRPDYLALSDAVQERLASLFKLHGAINVDPLLLMPTTEADYEDAKNYATFLDRLGNLVCLPSNLLVPFARAAAVGNHKRIKRFHVGNIYRPNPIAGHPLVTKAAVFDIITQDLEYGPIAAGAEVISLSNDILNAFPALDSTYNIRVSHSTIVERVMSRIPESLRDAVVEIILNSKSTVYQKRSSLLKKGLQRSVVDELELLNETETSLEDLITKMEKFNSPMLPLYRPALAELQSTLQYASYTSNNGDRQIFIHPLMLGNSHNLFQSPSASPGILIELVHKSKPGHVLAAGGRYDHLITRASAPSVRHHSTTKALLTSHTDETRLCAIGLQLALEKILAQLALFQSNYVKNLIKEERSFGFWSPRRCDVYVVSYQPGYLAERMEVVSYLWANGVSADVMYESAILSEEDRWEDSCRREGILFTVCPRPRTAKQTQSAFKVKSILKRTEYDLSKLELVSWLQYHIAEQKRIDLTTSGTSVGPLETAHHTTGGSLLGSRDASMTGADAVHLLLPGEVKKQRKQVKNILNDRAFETSKKVKSSLQSGMPTVAVDVPSTTFDAMCRSSAWITEDDAWKALTASGGFPGGHGYASQIRETMLRHREEGHAYILLFAVKEERIQLLALN